MVQTWTNADYHEFDATVRCHTSSVVTRSAATNVSTCAQSDSATTPTYITATVSPPIAVPRADPAPRVWNLAANRDHGEFMHEEAPRQPLLMEARPYLSMLKKGDKNTLGQRLLRIATNLPKISVTCRPASSRGGLG